MWILPFTKGTVLVECGRMLSKNDYRIKVLNTINFAKSMHYNPFAYIRSEKYILKLVNTIIVNTKGEEQNFSMLIDLVDASEAREDDENFKNAVDLLFEELEQKNLNHFAVRQYKKYKVAAGVVSLKRLLNQSNLKSWSSKMIKKSLEAYFFTLKNKIVFCKKQFQNMSVFCFVSTEIV